MLTATKKKRCLTREALNLLHDGAKVFSRMEHNGLKVDQGHLKSSIKKAAKEVEDLQTELKATKLWKKWKKKHGDKAKLSSVEQLGYLLFEDLGYKCYERTEPTERFPNGKPKVDESAVSRVKDPFVQPYMKLRKLLKLKNTYLEGIRRETVDGYLHPSFNLHLVETYRSSSDGPNFQNMPVRNPWMGEIIRKCIIFRGRGVEIDYSGIEVKVAYMYHFDPVMKKYLLDKTTDMHRDTAQELFKLKVAEAVSKAARHCAKNMFVFPQFYGSYYVECAASIWEELHKKDGDKRRLLVEGEGKSILKYLRGKGVKTYDQFEDHVKEVERSFWEDRFRVYDQWKRKWYDLYCKRGWFECYTGFRWEGPYRRNQVINYPVQSCAFHCLLKSLIVLQKRMDKAKMKSLLCGQIHDSGIGDVRENELQDYLGMATEVMTKTIPKMWDWINIPLEVEVDVTPRGGSWFDKAQWVEKNGIWSPKT